MPKTGKQYEEEDKAVLGLQASREPPVMSTAGRVLALQRAAGNRVTGMLLAQATVQREFDADRDEIAELAAVQRQTVQRSGPDREQEIELSRTSPGKASLVPGSLSLFNFAIDSAELKPFHVELLTEFASFLSTDVPADSTIRISGHTDATGPDAHNSTLSVARAETVAAFLRGTGLNADVTGAGKGSPAAPNDSVQGRSRNRRADIVLVATPRPRKDDENDHDKPPGPNGDKGLCDRYPILCRFTPPFPFIPPPFPLLCVLDPAICVVLPCLVNPALCTPPIPPPGPDDPDRPPDKNDPDKNTSGPHVEFGPVRAANTPAAMPDRIPDQGLTPVIAAVTEYDPSHGPILVRVNGSGTVKGTAEVDGAPETPIVGSTALGVGGTVQTTSGSYSLFLEATLNGAVIGRGRPFAVVSIMENMRIRPNGEVFDPATGASMFVASTWDSDGRAGVHSLGELEYQEHVAVVDEQDGMVGFGVGKLGLPGLASLEGDDEHGTPVDRMKQIGRQKLSQTFTMNEFRGGASEIPVTGSGFSIVRETVQDPSRAPGHLVFQITKNGEAGAADGFASGPGSGTATMRVPLDGSGGGGGTSPTTPVIPTPFFGIPPTGAVPMKYESGVPASAALGNVVQLVFSYKLDGEVFTSMMPCEVIAVTSRVVRLHTLNGIPVNVAPLGRDPVVLTPGKVLEVPKRLLR